MWACRRPTEADGGAGTTSSTRKDRGLSDGPTVRSQRWRKESRRISFTCRLAEAVRSGALHTKYLVRPVRLFEPRALGRRQGDRQRVEGLIELLHLRGADNGCRHARLVQQPRERDLCRRNAARAGDLHGAIDDVVVGVAVIEIVGEGVGLLPLCGRAVAAALPIAGEK